MIKVITFDLDDTLWEVTPVLIAAERRLMEWLEQHCPELLQHYSVQSMRNMRMELIKSRPDLAHQITEARRYLMQLAMERSGVVQGRAHELSQQAIEVFLEARHDVQLFDAVEEVIAELYSSYTLGVLTNGNADIYRLPLGRYFTFSYSAEMLNSSKPLPPHFEKTLRKTGARADQVIHVGDHIEHDIEGAQRSGWHTIWVNYKNKFLDGKVQPSETVSNIGEVPAAVRRIEAVQQKQ